MAERKDLRPAAARPSYLPEALREEAARHFQDWEQRGRGWDMWDAPVTLEPPFRPFIPYAPPPANYDDGIREDLISSVVTGLHRLLSGGWRRPEGSGTPDETDDEPGALLDGDESPLREFEVVLPASVKISHAFASRFLIALTYCRHALGFEVIGAEEGITVQLVCREPDAYPLREQLLSFFPEAVVRERDGFLARGWGGSAVPDTSGAESEAGENSDSSETAIVEFGLTREFLRPLQTYGGFDTDPLIAVTGAMSDMKGGECAVVQVLFAPAREAWAESALRAAGGDSELTSLARRKIASPLYAAVIRLAARGPDEERVWRVVKALGGAMAQFASPDGNALAPLRNNGYDDAEHAEDLLSRRSRRGAMLLNAEELVSLVHLPSASVRSPALRRQSEHTRAAPDIALGHDLVLGENEHEGETRTVTLSPEQRVRHMHLIGAPGTGKSTLLLNIALQDMERGEGVAVLDPHGDLIEQILERVPDHRIKDVILLDPSDEEFPVGFNILSAHSEVEKQLLASDLVAIFRRLSTAWGDQMTSVLGNAVLAFLESPRGGTLADLRRFLIEKEYRAEYLTTVRDSEVVYYWQKEFPMLTGNRSLGPLLTRLDTFLRPKLIRHMVAQKENRLDFTRIMNDGKILLAKISQGAVGKENAWLLGSLIVAKFHQLILARQETRESERRPFNLIIDEFPNFATPSMAAILSEARKYRLGLVLAHQSLRQITNDEVADAVTAHPYTRICFRLGDQDSGKMADGFSFFEAGVLRNLGTGEAVCRMERADYDFNLRTAPMSPADDDAARERAKRIRQLSRERYGTPREQVAADPDRDRAGHADAGAKRGERAAVEADAANAAPPERNSARSEADPEPEHGEAPAPSVGRGGPEHKHLQQLIGMRAGELGWKADIEHPLPAGGYADVTLERAGRRIACEICVTTSAGQEIANLEKCLAAGFARIITVSRDEERLKKIRNEAERRFSIPELEKMRFLTPEALFTLLEDRGARPEDSGGRIKGYEVAIRMSPADKGSMTARRRALGEAILGSIDDLREEERLRKNRQPGAE